MPTLRIEKNGEVLVLSPVVEGFRRQEIDPEGIAEIQKTDNWASKWHYAPSGRLSLSVQGTERIVHIGWYPGKARGAVGHDRRDLHRSLDDG